ncbi:hypothetical protein BASA84_000331 [Batrachochytrium salamandrivorans]|nr:hypothetical protein BASA84_000331 [Batrachochytrium salamandrivorans]
MQNDQKWLNVHSHRPYSSKNRLVAHGAGRGRRAVYADQTPNLRPPVSLPSETRFSSISRTPRHVLASQRMPSTMAGPCYKQINSNQPIHQYHYQNQSDLSCYGSIPMHVTHTEPQQIYTNTSRMKGVVENPVSIPHPPISKKPHLFQQRQKPKLPISGIESSRSLSRGDYSQARFQTMQSASPLMMHATRSQFPSRGGAAPTPSLNMASDKMKWRQQLPQDQTQQESTMRQYQLPRSHPSRILNRHRVPQQTYNTTHGNDLPHRAHESQLEPRYEVNPAQMHRPYEVEFPFYEQSEFYGVPTTTSHGKPINETKLLFHQLPTHTFENNSSPTRSIHRVPESHLNTVQPHLPRTRWPTPSHNTAQLQSKPTHRWVTSLKSRISLTTSERYMRPKYHVNESLGAVESDAILPPYIPYTQGEYRQLKSRDSHMKLPKGLGRNPNPQWEDQNDKRTRMNEYASLIRARDQEAANLVYRPPPLQSAVPIRSALSLHGTIIHAKSATASNKTNDPLVTQAVHAPRRRMSVTFSDNLESIKPEEVYRQRTAGSKKAHVRVGITDPRHCFANDAQPSHYSKVNIKTSRVLPPIITAAIPVDPVLASGIHICMDTATVSDTSVCTMSTSPPIVKAEHIVVAHNPEPFLMSMPENTAHVIDANMGNISCMPEPAPLRDIYIEIQTPATSNGADVSIMSTDTTVYDSVSHSGPTENANISTVDCMHGMDLEDVKGSNPNVESLEAGFESGLKEEASTDCNVKGIQIQDNYSPSRLDTDTMAVASPTDISAPDRSDVINHLLEPNPVGDDPIISRDDPSRVGIAIVDPSTSNPVDELIDQFACGIVMDDLIANPAYTPSTSALDSSIPNKKSELTQLPSDDHLEAAIVAQSFQSLKSTEDTIENPIDIETKLGKDMLHIIQDSRDHLEVPLPGGVIEKVDQAQEIGSETLYSKAHDMDNLLSPKDDGVCPISGEYDNRSLKSIDLEPILSSASQSAHQIHEQPASPTIEKESLADFVLTADPHLDADRVLSTPCLETQSEDSQGSNSLSEPADLSADQSINAM